ncbi:nitroreductase family protein [Methylosinus sp. H3A]|uniref:nitroreductase family protein n=1 Tax=Methylosinus sp. H3A TaxID=2785786 RepID=UPI0018C2A069|nr:nitroreductase family protein [Methylosinus sp. H3A]MBG0809346.1 nitroreductase family protein [Methylosinus sp. H3A]
MDKIGLDQGLRERRAVRHYSDAPVGDDLLSEIFELASWAPSPGNTQAWKVIALGQEASKDVIARFELAGWESVFPVLEQVLRKDAAERPSFASDGDTNDTSAAAVDWSRRVISMYQGRFEVKGAPRLVFVYRTVDRKRYANLVFLSLSSLIRRAWAKPSLLDGLRCFFSSLRNVPVLVRVNALTRTFGLANFTYALTLAAHSRGLATCIQSNYLNVQRDLRRYLGFGADVDIVASVLIGYKAADALPAPEIFRTRKPVAVDWIDATPGVAVASPKKERAYEAVG